MRDVGGMLVDNAGLLGGNQVKIYGDISDRLEEMGGQIRI